MSFTVQVINDTFAVSGQLSAADMAAVAQAGYRSVIINRPDFEAGPQQPVADVVMRAAHEAGLVAEYQPVISGALTQEDAKRFAQLYTSLPKPILAYCRSGGRCFNLYQLSSQI